MTCTVRCPPTSRDKLFGPRTVQCEIVEGAECGNGRDELEVQDGVSSRGGSENNGELAM